MVSVLPDGSYLSVLVRPALRRARRAAIIEAARAGQDIDPADAHLVRVIEYDVPDREGSGTGELIVLLTTITSPGDARAGELTSAYHHRWEEETANDQLKTHLRGPGRILRSRLPDLVHQEIWAYLIPLGHGTAGGAKKPPATSDHSSTQIPLTRRIGLQLIPTSATVYDNLGVPEERGLWPCPPLEHHTADGYSNASDRT